MGKTRLLDRLGYIRVYHKDTGEKRTYPISPKIYNNKARMAQLGYYDIPEPEAPEIEEEDDVEEFYTDATPEIPKEMKTEVKAETPTPKRGRKKKVENGN